MKGAINVIAAALLLMLAGCAQKPAPEAGFRSQGAASYVHAHGLKVDMQLPQAFVGASTVIDAKVAQDAAKSSHNLIANSGNTAGLAGLLVASLINTQMGSGSLQRDAENAALKEARPMADLLADAVQLAATLRAAMAADGSGNTTPAGGASLGTGATTPPQRAPANFSSNQPGALAGSTLGYKP